MTPERWEQIGEVYKAALERSADERARFLDQECDVDAELRSEVEALLAASDCAGSFMSGDAMEDAARLLSDEQTGSLIGQTLGHYRVLDLLGQGGMGEVYLAQDIHLKRNVALKILPAYFLISRDRASRFEQEARAISALNHPNIVTIHEVGRFNGSNFIVTEFVEGQTLRELISDRRLNVLEALDFGIQIANALDAAHAAGIIHRDIKPENIVVRHDGYVKVLDFGLAKLAEGETAANLGEMPTKIFARTQPGLVMGSTSYLSPEQARGDEVDERTDIWSLGVVLYELLTGRTPFEGETSSHVVVSILEEDPPSLRKHLVQPPEKLQRIIGKALRKNRDERYQTVKELSSDLKTLKQELERAGDGGTFSITARDTAESRTTAANVRATSSAQYLVNEIKQHKTGVALTAAIVIFVSVAIGYGFLFREKTETELINSLAVLPFVNVDNDPNKQYLCEGISDSLVDKLSRLPNLRVASFNSVLRYRGQQPDPQTAGKALNVRAVLIGRVQQRGDDLTISTELVDVRDNHRLWGEQYNRKMSDLVGVQSEIAQYVSEKLRPQLSGAQQQRLAKNYTDNVRAYQFCTLGDYYARQQTKESLIKSIEFYDQAINIDRNYALAYVGLFKAYFSLGLRGYWSPKECQQKAEWAALRSVELDDSLAEAHVALAFAKESLRWDWAGAEKECRRALELNPNSFSTNFCYATFLARAGRASEALPYAQRAEEFDPLYRLVGLVFLHKREFDKAIQLYLQAKTPAAPFLLAEAYIGGARYAEAIAQMQKAIANNDSPESWNYYPILAYAYAASGQRDEALKILSNQVALAKKTYISPTNFAIIYTGLGDKDRAFEYLNKAYDEHAPMLNYLPGRPLFDPLRSDPRFAELLRKMNLPPERFLKASES